MRRVTVKEDGEETLRRILRAMNHKVRTPGRRRVAELEEREMN